MPQHIFASARADGSSVVAASAWISVTYGSDRCSSHAVSSADHSAHSSRTTTSWRPLRVASSRALAIDGWSSMTMWPCRARCTDSSRAMASSSASTSAASPVPADRHSSTDRVSMSSAAA